MKFRLKDIFSFKRGLPEDSQSSGTSTSSEIKFDSMSWLKGLSYDVSLNTAMKFTAVFAAMRLRAETIASLPKQVVERTASGRIDAKDHPAYKLLKYRPNNFMNIFSFWEYINACLDGWGNAYVVIFRQRGGMPGELVPIHPSLVTISFVNRKKWYRVVGSKYFDGTYSDDDMLHFFSLSLDGIKGINPISYNSAAIKSGLSSTSFGNDFFESGGSIKGVFETEQALDLKVCTDLAERLSNLPNYATPILERGLKYKEVGIAPEAAQMLETRTFALQDIARIFNIPPHMIADLSRATFSNIEHQDIQFVKYSIRPTVKRFETELDRKLFFDDEQGKMEIKFNLDGMLRGDMKTRAEYYQKAVLSGWMSRNEVRELENMNLAEGLDVFLCPVNQVASTKTTKNNDNGED